MPAMIDTSTMITKLSGMLGTKHVTEWETEFITKLAGYVVAGQVTRLSDKQVESLDKLYSKHFA